MPMYRVEPPASAPCLPCLGGSKPARPFPWPRPGSLLSARGRPRGCPCRRSVCVHLSPDHTHYLLLDFGVLSIDIGVSHLAVFVPGRGEGGVRGCPMGVPRVPVRWAQPRTHTKKKRVQTWSETGQTQMLPCFCRSLEVMTAGGRGCQTGGRRSLLGAAHGGDPPSSLLHPPGEPGMWVPPVPHLALSCVESPPPRQVPAPSQSAMQFRLRLWRKRDWMERVCGESSRHYPPWPGSVRPVPSTRGCHVPILPRCPLARHLGDGVHSVVPLHQLVLRRHPVLPFPHP